jgi:hypothetical protein
MFSLKSSKNMSSDAASINSTSTMNSSKHLLRREKRSSHTEKKTLTPSEKAAKILEQDRARSERFLNNQATFLYFSMK